MTVLVTAASKHGATRQIAEEIARVLAEHGVSTELLDLEDVSDLSGYEAYVVGKRDPRGRTRVATSSSPASWTRARSACSSELPCAARTPARATTATGTRWIGGPRRSRDSRALA